MTAEASRVEYDISNRGDRNKLLADNTSRLVIQAPQHVPASFAECNHYLSLLNQFDQQHYHEMLQKLGTLWQHMQLLSVVLPSILPRDATAVAEWINWLQHKPLSELYAIHRTYTEMEASFCKEMQITAERLWRGFSYPGKKPSHVIMHLAKRLLPGAVATLEDDGSYKFYASLHELLRVVQHRFIEHARARRDKPPELYFSPINREKIMRVLTNEIIATETAHQQCLDQVWHAIEAQSHRLWPMMQWCFERGFSRLLNFIPYAGLGMVAGAVVDDTVKHFAAPLIKQPAFIEDLVQQYLDQMPAFVRHCFLYMGDRFNEAIQLMSSNSRGPFILTGLTAGIYYSYSSYNPLSYLLMAAPQVVSLLAGMSSTLIFGCYDHQSWGYFLQKYLSVDSRAFKFLYASGIYLSHMIANPTVISLEVLSVFAYMEWRYSGTYFLLSSILMRLTVSVLSKAVDLVINENRDSLYATSAELSDEERKLVYLRARYTRNVTALVSAFASFIFIGLIGNRSNFYWKKWKDRMRFIQHMIKLMSTSPAYRSYFGVLQNLQIMSHFLWDLFSTSNEFTMHFSVPQDDGQLVGYTQQCVLDDLRATALANPVPMRSVFLEVSPFGPQQCFEEGVCNEVMMRVMKTLTSAVIPYDETMPNFEVVCDAPVAVGSVLSEPTLPGYPELGVG